MEFFTGPHKIKFILQDNNNWNRGNGIIRLIHPFLNVIIATLAKWPH